MKCRKTAATIQKIVAVFCFITDAGEGCVDMPDKRPSNITDNKVVLNEQEQRLIQMIRETRYGDLRIFVSEGKPIRVEEIKKSIKL